MRYLSTSEAAEKWGLSSRRVVVLCNEGLNLAIDSTWIPMGQNGLLL